MKHLPATVGGGEAEPMSSQLDLRQLVIERSHGPARKPAGPAPRHVLSRYVVPGALLVGFLLVLAWAGRESLLPSAPVTVVPVIVTRAEVQQAGTPLFQAAGWIEPRPSPVLVSSLAEGVIEKLLVVPGQDVAAGEPIAQLVDTDARLALRKAEADHDLKQAELDSAKAEVTAARLRMERPVHLEAAAAEAEALLAQAETELAKLPFELRAAQARAEIARKEMEGKRAAGEAVAGRLLQKAQSELDAATAHLEELQQRKPRLERAVQTLRRKRDALATQRELKVDEARQRADAEAKLQAAEARCRQAQIAVEAAKLHLERMAIRAPVAGRVLRIMASPGTRMAGMTFESARDASTALSLYDPKALQVRIDVRLEDVARVEPGQPVRIETPSAPGPMHGQVIQITSEASVQKNTLEVKVAIDDPPATIRPEMLVQATFLAVDRGKAQDGSGQAPERLLVPRQLVENSEGQATVWIADARGRAQRQPIKLGSAGTAELVEVLEGLAATDKLIASGREALDPGTRIRILGEDSAIGTTQ